MIDPSPEGERAAQLKSIEERLKAARRRLQSLPNRPELAQGLAELSKELDTERQFTGNLDETLTRALERLTQVEKRLWGLEGQVEDALSHLERLERGS